MVISAPRFVLLTAFLPVFLNAASLSSVLSRTGLVRTDTIRLRNLDTSHQYSFLYALKSPRLSPAARVEVEIVQGSDLLATKILHAGDADFYTQLRLPKA